MDRMQWTVLVKQLEDLLALQCLLKLRPANRFAAAMVTGEQEPITVSVKKVLDGGRGKTCLQSVTGEHMGREILGM